VPLDVAVFLAHAEERTAERRKVDVTAREHGTAKIIHFFGQMAEESITLENQSKGRAGRTMTFQRVKD